MEEKNRAKHRGDHQKERGKKKIVSFGSKKGGIPDLRNSREPAEVAGISRLEALSYVE
jgi:hypothetical protein